MLVLQAITAILVLAIARPDISSVCWVTVKSQSSWLYTYIQQVAIVAYLLIRQYGVKGLIASCGIFSVCITAFYCGRLIYQRSSDWYKVSTYVSPVVPRPARRCEGKVHCDYSGPYIVAELENGAKVEVTLPIWASALMASGTSRGPIQESMIQGSYIYPCPVPKGVVSIRDLQGGILGVGTRVTVEGENYLMTAWHVLKLAHSNGALLVSGPKGEQSALFDNTWPVHAWSGGSSLDFVLCKVPPFIWTVLKVQTLKTRSMPAKASVSVYGCGSDGTWATSTGNAVAVHKKFAVIRHHASTRPGWSGSPIMMGSFVVGVHVSGDVSGNVGAACDAFLKKLESDQVAVTWKQRVEDFDDDFVIVDEDDEWEVVEIEDSRAEVGEPSRVVRRPRQRNVPRSTTLHTSTVVIGNGRVTIRNDDSGAYHQAIESMRTFQGREFNWADEDDDSFGSGQESGFRQGSSTSPSVSPSDTSGVTNGPLPLATIVAQESSPSQGVGLAASQEAPADLNVAPVSTHTSDSRVFQILVGQVVEPEQSLPLSSSTPASTKEGKNPQKKKKKKSSPKSSPNTQGQPSPVLSAVTDSQTELAALLAEVRQLLSSAQKGTSPSSSSSLTTN